MDNGNKQIRVCLIGADFDTQNRGVSALSSSLVRLVTETVPGAKISFFTGNPARSHKVVNFAGKDVPIDVINFRLSPRAKLQEHIFFLLFLTVLIRLIPSARLREKIVHWNSRLSDVYQCDVIGAINGGDSFSDIYGLWSFLYGAAPMVITILLGKSLTLLPQTYGPYYSRLARTIAKWIILHSGKVLSRDHDSIRLINELLNKSGKKVAVTFCPDVAFTLPSEFPASFAVHPTAEVFGKDAWIGINISGLLFNNSVTGTNRFGLRFDYKTFILDIIEKLMTESSTKIILIPHTYGGEGSVESDTNASKQVYDLLKDKYKNRLSLLTGEYREFEIKGIIGRCDFFIGSRMHACIAAISQDVPTAAVAYSKKFHGVFEGVGLATMVVDARSVNLDEAIQRIVDLFHNRETERISIKQKIDSAKKQVKETFRQLLSTPGPGSEAR